MREVDRIAIEDALQSNPLAIAEAEGHLKKGLLILSQEIGLVGMSGDASQPMLHFEVRYAPAPGAKTRPIDPVLALPTG